MAWIEISPKGDRFQAGNLLLRHATAVDDAALQLLLRNNPMQGWLRLALERSPSYFAGEGLFSSTRVVICEDSAASGAIVGMYHTAFLPLYVNGAKLQAAYLGELRVNPDYRNRPRILKHGFASIRPLNQPEADKTAIWFTSIASDNLPARRLLEARHRQLPRYTPVGEMHTLALSVRHGRQPELLQQATPADIPALCDFYNLQAARHHFAPCIEPTWLEQLSPTKGLGIGDFWLWKDQQRLRACIAVWDQRGFKQAVVQGYRFPLNLLRPAYNLFAYARGIPSLPASGRRLESVILAFFVIDPAVQSHALPILREALEIAARKHARIALLGLAETNPLLPAAVASLHPTIYRTCIETVRWPEQPALSLDHWIVQPEIALL